MLLFNNLNNTSYHVYSTWFNNLNTFECSWSEKKKFKQSIYLRSHQAATSTIVNGQILNYVTTVQPHYVVEISSSVVLLFLFPYTTCMYTQSTTSFIISPLGHFGTTPDHALHVARVVGITGEKTRAAQTAPFLNYSWLRLWHKRWQNDRSCRT